MPDDILRILIADDDQETCTIISQALEHAGFLVDCVGRGDDAEVHINAGTPYLLIVELLLPGLSGLELCRRLREREGTANLPIIFISSQNQERDRVQALTVGADDFVGKPFSTLELIARVEALLRRCAVRHPGDRLVIGDLVVDLTARRVSRYGRMIHLSPLEYGLLVCLMQRPGQVFSRPQLLEAVWPVGTDFIIRTVDVQMGRLRKMLSYDGERDPILTVRGEGYSFDKTFDMD